MKRFTVEWVGATASYSIAELAMTPTDAARSVYKGRRLFGTIEFTVIAEDGHTSLVKVGSDG